MRFLSSSTRAKGSTGAIHQKGKTPDRRGKGLVGLVVGRCWACPMWPMWAMWAYQHCPALHYHPAKQTTLSGKPGLMWPYSRQLQETYDSPTIFQLWVSSLVARKLGPTPKIWGPAACPRTCHGPPCLLGSSATLSSRDLPRARSPAHTAAHSGPCAQSSARFRVL